MYRKTVHLNNLWISNLFYDEIPNKGNYGRNLKDFLGDFWVGILVGEGWLGKSAGKLANAFTLSLLIKK